MTQYKKTLSRITATIFTAALPLVSFAQIENPLKGISSIPGFISTILGYAVRIGGVIAIFAFIYSGFKFVQARGNPTELETAKRIFINTCIGVAVLLGAQLIASIIVGTIRNIR
jgi:hypothetical protein